MANTPIYGFETPDDTDLVKDGALSIRTALGDVDTTLGTALNSKDHAGLVLVKKQAIGTGVSTVSVTNAFSATYDAYRIIVAGGTGSTNDNIAIKLTGSGSNYSWSLIYVDYGSTTPAGGSAINSANVSFVGYNHSSVGKSLVVDVVNPFLTTYTTFHANTVGNTLAGISNGIHKASTSYTGFEIVTSASMTGGNIYVYGYGAS